MPFGLLQVTPDVVAQEEKLKHVIACLPAYIANALSCGDTPETGCLTWADVDIGVSENHRLSRIQHDIVLIVFAHDYEAWKANLDDRRQDIQSCLKDNLSTTGFESVTVGVEVFLGDSSWGTFKLGLRAF